MTDVVIDLETTGLDPERHDIWEIAAIVRDHRECQLDGEWWWQLRPNLAAAEPIALRKGCYYERTHLPPDMPVPAAVVLDSPWGPEGQLSPAAVASRLAVLLDQATVYGAVPTFDVIEFLRPFLRRHGQCGTWNHRLRCVETLAEGHLRRKIGGLRDCADALGITYDPEDLHTGLGDARLADAVRARVLDHEHEWISLKTVADPDDTELCVECSTVRIVERLLPDVEDEVSCRVCGCTDSRPCDGGCSWVPDPQGGDLCSSCAPGQPSVGEVGEGNNLLRVAARQIGHRSDTTASYTDPGSATAEDD